jgi:hypothetical protein
LVRRDLDFEYPFSDFENLFFGTFPLEGFLMVHYVLPENVSLLRQEKYLDARVNVHKYKIDYSIGLHEDRLGCLWSFDLINNFEARVKICPADHEESSMVRLVIY